MSSSIASGITFNASTDYSYTKSKLNSRGGKQIGILNNKTKKGLYISTPLMMTWGSNTYTDEKTGVNTYDLALQFPNEEYNTEECSKFLKNMQELENKIKEDAITNCKDWFGKPKLVAEAVDALWTPMLKYPRVEATQEPDYTRSPTLKVKIPYWEGEFKNVELYNEDSEMLFPNDNGIHITDLITKGSTIATIIQCGGIWSAAGKFGVTWKLFQAVVKPKETLSGRCHISLSTSDKEKLKTSNVAVEDEDEDIVETSFEEKTKIADSDDENDVTLSSETVKQEVEDVIEQTKSVAVEDVPKTKKVVKKKKPAAASSSTD
jgi:hypothetical protein